MRAYRRVGVAVALLCAAASGQAPAWKPAGGNPLTEWAARVDPARPLAEYPRPQMMRNQWRNLNGLWEYAVTDLGAARPGEFEGRILVPFSIESALSGVKRPLTAKQNLWYRRSFDDAAPARDQRVLLHFGAVDWEAGVFLNGKELGTHKGGYDGFSFDIPALSRPTTSSSFACGTPREAMRPRRASSAWRPSPSLRAFSTRLARGSGRRSGSRACRPPESQG